MTQSWLRTFELQADKIDKTTRHWINEGLKDDIDKPRIAKLLGICIGEVTAVYYADNHYLKGKRNE